MSWRLPKAAGSFDRTIPAATTAERLLERAKLYGITRVTEIGTLDDLGMHVHSAVRPRSVSTSTISLGKGETAADSLAGALAEAIELDCCERFRPADLVVGSYEELRDRAPVFLTRRGLPGDFALPTTVRLEWVWCEDLLADGPQRRRLLPFDLVRQGSVGHGDNRLLGSNMSSGIASGNVLEEAIGHAIDELIERDALAIFTFRGKYCFEDLRGKYRRIELATLPARARRLVDLIHAAGRRVSLVEMTSDVGVPAVACCLMGGVVGLANGFGASLDPERSIIRAITEAAQTSAGNIQGSREDLSVEARDPKLHGRGIGMEHPRVREVFEDRSIAARPFAQMRSLAGAYIDEDLHTSLEQLRRAGIRNVFCVDVSDEHCQDFRAVRVVIPQLEKTRLDTIGPRRLRYALEPL